MKVIKSLLLVSALISSVEFAFAIKESDDIGIPPVVYDDGDLYVMHSTKDSTTGSVYYQYNKTAKTKFVDCMSKSKGSYTMEVSLYYAEVIDFLGREKVCKMTNKIISELER